MITLNGHYYDGLNPVAQPAQLACTSGEATLIVGQVIGRYAVSALNVSPRIGRTDRFITLPGHGQFQCPDQDFLDSLPQASPSEGPVAWLEQRWEVALMGVVIVACILLAGYFYGLPIAAEFITERIPLETEQALGRNAMTWLDDNGWLKPSTLDANAQQRVKDGFEKLLVDLPMREHYRLEMRYSKALGANAFALPGGTIVLLDDMVLTADTTEEVQAVLAHEIGHVALRHTLRSVLQNSAVAIAAAAVTSDAASLSVAVAGLPVLFAQTKYSRTFESEADEYAFKLLKQKGYSPEAFALIMERLEFKNGKDGRMFSYLSTHPVTEERVKRARDAAKK
jgi:predicted Zn-dependent protease